MATSIAPSDAPPPQHVPQQESFVAAILELGRQYRREQNPVLRVSLREAADKKITSIASNNFTGWRGKVIGISASETRANLAIDVGGVVLKSGSSFAGDIDTEIVRGSKMYDLLSLINVGDSVVVSGSFEFEGGRIRSLALSPSNTLQYYSDIAVRFSDVRAD